MMLMVPNLNLLFAAEVNEQLVVVGVAPAHLVTVVAVPAAFTDLDSARGAGESVLELDLDSVRPSAAKGVAKMKKKIKI